MSDGIKQVGGAADESKSAIRAFNDGILRLGRYVASIAALYYTFKSLTGAITGSLNAIDDFRLITVGVAATITDMATDQSKGQQNFNQALAYSTVMYEKLELAAAKYFASGQELIEGWNILIMNGLVLQEQDIDNLGIIVDRIKLMTRGQMSSIQIAQELRAIMQGTARETSVFAKMMQSRLGAAW